MNFVNKLIKVIIPLLPKSIVKLFANKYIAGIKTNEALQTIEKLNQLNLESYLLNR